MPITRLGSEFVGPLPTSCRRKVKNGGMYFDDMRLKIYFLFACGMRVEDTWRCFGISLGSGVGLFDSIHYSSVEIAISALGSRNNVTNDTAMNNNNNILYRFLLLRHTAPTVKTTRYEEELLAGLVPIDEY